MPFRGLISSNPLLINDIRDRIFQGRRLSNRLPTIPYLHVHTISVMLSETKEYRKIMVELFGNDNSDLRYLDSFMVEKCIAPYINHSTEKTKLL